MTDAEVLDEALSAVRSQTSLVDDLIASLRSDLAEAKRQAAQAWEKYAEMEQDAMDRAAVAHEACKRNEELELAAEQRDLEIGALRVECEQLRAKVVQLAHFEIEVSQLRKQQQNAYAEAYQRGVDDRFAAAAARGDALSRELAALHARCKCLGQQSADDVTPGATFLGGDGIDLGDSLRVEADGEELSGHDGSVAR